VKDRYFFASLITTMFFYLVLIIAFTVFVIFTGIAGFLFIVVSLVLLLAYFYDGFKKIRNKGGLSRSS
jgi:heme O synthase-like polyprenyltransferase